MWGVVPVTDAILNTPICDVAEMELSPLMLAMATCHSLTRIEGIISGDPLDVKVIYDN